MDAKKQNVLTERKRKTDLKLKAQRALDKKKSAVEQYKQQLMLDLNTVKDERQQFVLKNREKIMTMSPINVSYPRTRCRSKSPSTNRSLKQGSKSPTQNSRVSSRTPNIVTRSTGQLLLSNSQIINSCSREDRKEARQKRCLFFKMSELINEVEVTIIDLQLDESIAKKELISLLKEIKSEVNSFSQLPNKSLCSILERYRLLLVDMALLMEGVQRLVNCSLSKKETKKFLFHPV